MKVGVPLGRHTSPSLREKKNHPHSASRPATRRLCARRPDFHHHHLSSFTFSFLALTLPRPSPHLSRFFSLYLITTHHIPRPHEDTSPATSANPPQISRHTLITLPITSRHPTLSRLNPPSNYLRIVSHTLPADIFTPSPTYSPHKNVFRFLHRL